VRESESVFVRANKHPPFSWRKSKRRPNTSRSSAAASPPARPALFPAARMLLQDSRMPRHGDGRERQRTEPDTSYPKLGTRNLDRIPRRTARSSSIVRTTYPARIGTRIRADPGTEGPAGGGACCSGCPWLPRYAPPSETGILKPETRNPEPGTRRQEPETRNPKPET